MRQAAALLAVLAGAAACDDGDRFEPVQLDTSPNCARAAVDVLVPDMDRDAQPWARVLSVVLDEPGLLSFWALVESDTPSRALAMVHVRQGVVDHEVALAAFLPDTQDVQLVPGPNAGSAWLVETGTASFRAWQFEAVNPGIDPLRAVSPNLGWFPGSLAELCIGEITEPLEPPPRVPCDVADWHRELAFVEGQPFIISTAPFSPDATMYVYAGRMRPDLGVTEQTQLEFFRQCVDGITTPPDIGCESEFDNTTYPRLTVMGSQQDPSQGTHHQFVLRDRERDRVPVARELVGLMLDLDQDDKIRGFVFSQGTNPDLPSLGPPAGLATDDLSAYLMYSSEANDGVSLVRLRTTAASDGFASDRFEFLTGVPLQTAPESLALLQMPGDIALGWLENGAWQLLKLFPDAPSSSEPLAYAPSAAVTAVRSAGRGAYLVFKDHDDGPDLVQLRCDD